MSPTKIYTNRIVFMMEKSIADFHTSLYIPEIQEQVFHPPHVRILGTNNYGTTRPEAFKHIIENQYVLWRRDYDERVVDSFANQIQSEYHGNNNSVSIEGNVLEHFSPPTHTKEKETQHARTYHAVFTFFYYIKKDSSTTTAHRKRIIKILKELNILFDTLSKIWGNTDGCAEHYICATTLYLISMLSQDFYGIIECGIIASVHGRELLYGLNTVDKRFISN